MTGRSLGTARVSGDIANRTRGTGGRDGSGPSLAVDTLRLGKGRFQWKHPVETSPKLCWRHNAWEKGAGVKSDHKGNKSKWGRVDGSRGPRTGPQECPPWGGRSRQSSERTRPVQGHRVLGPEGCRRRGTLLQADSSFRAIKEHES